MIVTAQALRRRRRLSLAFGTSALAWGLTLPASAQAQCAPDPTVANGTTTCTGTDANGIRVTTSGTTLTIAAGATVSNTGAPAIAVDVPRTSSTYGYDTVNVLGSVSSPDQNAITVSSGALGTSAGYSSQNATLTVASGGSVTGGAAIALLQSPGNNNGTVIATLDNAGTLTGTGGIALLGVVPTGNANNNTYPPTTFSTITNRAGASISGGILGPVGTLTNAGTIGGGTNGALNTGNTPGYSYTTVTNAATGTIRAASSAATLAAGTITLTNAGTITNTGTGAVVSGGTVSITNQAGGQITNPIRTAIAATASLSLINQGTITGNVVTGNGPSSVDSSSGTINGSVTFGAGNDTLVARYVGTRALATGITGGVDGGGGTNTERLVFTVDTSVTTPIDRDANFQQLVLAPAAGVTATLQTGFTTTSALTLSGAGTVVNRAALAIPGPAVTDDYSSSGTFRNEGSITASTAANSGQYGLLLNDHSLVNTGTIAVTGGGGGASVTNAVTNSGTITAAGTGVYVFDGVLTNNGTIASTAGTGAYLYGNVGITASNSGTIRGAATGVTTYLYLTNTGTISSAGTGVSVQPYGYLVNAAGGVVNGGSGGAATVSAFNAGIANAGTLSGNVSYSGDSSLNYIALPGGVLNGNLSLSGARWSRA